MNSSTWLFQARSWHSRTLHFTHQVNLFLLYDLQNKTTPTAWSLLWRQSLSHMSLKTACDSITMHLNCLWLNHYASKLPVTQSLCIYKVWHIKRRHSFLIFEQWQRWYPNSKLHCIFLTQPSKYKYPNLCPTAVHILLSLFLLLHNHKTIHFPMTYILSSLPQAKGYKVNVWKSSWMKFSTSPHPSQKQCLSSCPFISLAFRNMDSS